MDSEKQIKVVNCLLNDVLVGELSKYDYQIDDLLFVEFNNSLHNLVSSPEDGIYIAFFEDKVVGVLIMDSEKYIKYVCVDENHRNKGVATALLNCCITYHSEVYLRLHYKDITNIQIFTKIGLKVKDKEDSQIVFSYKKKD